MKRKGFNLSAYHIVRRYGGLTCTYCGARESESVSIHRYGPGQVWCRLCADKFQSCGESDPTEEKEE